MMEFLFWFSVGLILWSYLGYPVLVKMLDRKPFENKKISEFPEVDVVFAAYNEESVIEEKIHSIYKSEYPREKIHVYIGSDASTDRTDEIITTLRSEYPNLHLERMPGRTGKSGIINHLVENVSRSELILGTDANIYFTPKLIGNLVRHFEETNCALVGGHIIYRDIRKEGIAQEEGLYLSYENRIKQHESNLWNIALGVEGGCYMIRRPYFKTIPPLTFMEDFYLTMSTLKQGGHVIFDSEANCTEDVSVDRAEEFKRKVRISLGNFQNLSRFYQMIWQRPYPIGFAFFSHKVLRWITPLLLLLSFVSSILLAIKSEGWNLYTIAFSGQLALFLIFIGDRLFPSTLGRTFIFRFVGHFYLMNFALFKGLITYLQGVESNVWQPTKRAQKRS